MAVKQEDRSTTPSSASRGAPPIGNDSRAFSGSGKDFTTNLELLKLKSKEAELFTSNIVRTIALFLAVTGGLLKFALDRNATENLRMALSVMGLVTSLLVLLACYLGERYRRSLKEELNSLKLALRRDASAERLTGIFNLVVGAVGLAVTALMGWIFLIMF